MPELAWRVHASVPLDWGWADNRIWAARYHSYGRRLTDEAEVRRGALAAAMITALHGRRVVVAPLWLRIHCLIPNHRGDAINVLKLAADAVQVATGLDDRWYHLSGLSWELMPDKPELRVWVGQVELVDVRRRRSVVELQSEPPEPDPDPLKPAPWKAR